MPPSRHDAAAAERKRMRDRIAQQNLRNKRIRHVQTLEQQLALCRELHGSQDTGHYVKCIEELRAENSRLRERQKRLRTLLRSCEDVLRRSPSPEEDREDARPGRSSESLMAQCQGGGTRPVSRRSASSRVSDCIPAPKESPLAQSQYLSTELTASGVLRDGDPEDGATLAQISVVHPHTFQHVNLADSITSGREVEFGNNGRAAFSPYGAAQTDRGDDLWAFPPPMSYNLVDFTQPGTFTKSLESSVPFLGLGLWNSMEPGTEKSMTDLPPWAQIPSRTISSKFVQHSPWDADLRIVYDAPDIPSPLDLLFGSQKNPLASLVHRNIRDWYRGAPERLAIGWLVYHYIKWRVEPSVERYSRVPDCLKPAPEQTWLQHPGCLDLIVWKKLRLNMLNNHKKYDIEAFIRLYCSCLKLRWARDDDILVPNEEGIHVVRPDFLDRLLTEDGWGLKLEFVSQYPELFADMELQKVLYDTS